MKRFVFVDYRISNEEYFNLNKYCYIIKVPPCKALYSAIEGHPDILLHILSPNEILIHKNIDPNFINFLRSNGFKVFLSNSELSSKYPADIILNAVSVKNLFIHNTKFTDKALLEHIHNIALKNHDFKIINTKQGYTKCSLAVLNDTCFITSDSCLYNKLREHNYTILYVPPGDILLPNLDYGFIGGCCGMIEADLIAFYGNLNCYKYGKEVLNFLDYCNIKPIYLSEGKLIDRGSILHI